MRQNQQHPQTGIFAKKETDKTVLNYFILRMEKDGLFKDVAEKVYGPLTEGGFISLQKELEIVDVEFSIKFVVDEDVLIE